MSTNILIYEPYPFDMGGGNQTTLSYILRFSHKEKSQYVLISPFETDYIRKLSAQGIDCIIVEPTERLKKYGGQSLRTGLAGLLMTFFSIISYNIALFKIIRAKKINVIYCNCVRSVITVALAAKLSKVPIVWYIKSELQNKLLDLICFVLSSKILFMCESNKKDKYPLLTKLFKNKIDILIHGIDLKRIDEVSNKNKEKIRTELAIEKNNINIAYLGLIYPLKGVHYLIDALNILIKQFPDIKLYIVGDCVLEEYGNYLDSIKAMIDTYGISNNVSFTGWREDAIEILSLMDILVHPSTSEGTPLVVLEAMALGKPVIATKVGGLRELIEDGENGYLIDSRNPRMIAERLTSLINNKAYAQEMGRNAKDKVYKEYDVINQISRLEEIWSEMVHK